MSAGYSLGSAYVEPEWYTVAPHWEPARAHRYVMTDDRGAVWTHGNSLRTMIRWIKERPGSTAAGVYIRDQKERRFVVVPGVTSDGAQ